MKVRNYKSQCTPELNTRVMRGIEHLVCDYRKILPNGWRCCIEFQRSDEDKPYYELDIESNQGGGSFAPVKMQMLRLCPTISATGNTALHLIIDGLQTAKFESEDPNKWAVIDKLLNHLTALHNTEDITDGVWEELKLFGLTHWYGGIRIPYDIQVTKHDEDGQHVDETTGEIRITFSGAKEWQDLFFCFRIFQKLQVTLNSLWGKDQIWHNLRGFGDPTVQFWVDALGIDEAPER